MNRTTRRTLWMTAAAALITTAHAHAALLFVLNKLEGTVSLLNPESGETVATLTVGEGPHEAATSPDGRTVVVCNYGRQTPGSTLSVIDVPSRTVVKTIDLKHYHRPHGIQYFADGRRVVVTAEAERNLLIVDVEKGVVEHAIGTDQDISHMVALGPDARRAFVANIRSGSVSVIDLKNKRLERIIATGEGAEGVALHPGGKEVWVTNRAADTLTILHAETLEELASVPCSRFPIRVAITPDGTRALVSCAATGEVAVFDTTTRAEVARIKMEAEATDDDTGRLFGRTFGDSPVPVGILIEPTGRLAYVANTNADVIIVIDIAKAEIVGTLRAGREPDGLAWTHLD